MLPRGLQGDRTLDGDFTGETPPGLWPQSRRQRLGVAHALGLRELVASAQDAQNEPVSHALKRNGARPVTAERAWSPQCSGRSDADRRPRTHSRPMLSGLVPEPSALRTEGISGPRLRTSSPQTQPRGGWGSPGKDLFPEFGGTVRPSGGSAPSYLTGWRPSPRHLWAREKQRGFHVIKG